MVPYDLYVRFLVTKGLEDLGSVNQNLNDLNLPAINESEFSKQHQIVHQNVPEYVSRSITDKNLAPDFIKTSARLLEVDELWRFEKQYKTMNDAWIRLVYDIHSDPTLRLTIDCLLIKKQSSEDIVRDLNLKFSTMFKNEHIDLYRKFFFDPARMTRKDWNSFLKRCDGPFKLMMMTALTGDLDELKTELDLPSNPDVSTGLRYIFATSMKKVKLHMNMNSPESEREARSWINTAIMAADKYQKYAKANVEDFGKSLQMQFAYIETDFETPDVALATEIKKKQLMQIEEKERKDNAQ